MLIFSIVSFETLFFEVIGYFIHTSLEIPLSDPLFSLYLIFCCLTNISGLDNLFNGSFVSPSWLFITITNRVQLRADAFKVRGCHVLSRRLFNFLLLLFLKLNFWSQFKGWIIVCWCRCESCDLYFAIDIVILGWWEGRREQALRELTWLVPECFLFILITIAVAVIRSIGEDLTVGGTFSVFIRGCGWPCYSWVIVITKFQFLHLELLRQLFRIADLRRGRSRWESLVRKHLSRVDLVHLAHIEPSDVQVAHYGSSVIAHLSYFLLF